MESKICILDCTLRDGGYVNNWEFSRQGILEITNKLNSAGVEYIECGIMGKALDIGEVTKFNSFQEIEPFLKDRKPSSIYTIMITFSEKDAFFVPPRSKNTVDCIRIAFFKSEMKGVLLYAKKLKELGYEVFLQAMATPLYSEEELRELISVINEIKPTAFYIVDSFGTMFNEDVEKTVQLVHSKLNQDIILGFHAHNNIQLAFSNCISFLKIPINRRRIIDSSVFGMGRGAGNVATELIATYLNNNYHKNYNINILLEIYEKILRPIFSKYYWGYSAQYFLTASKGINSAYGWYIVNKGIESLQELDGILDLIPFERRYGLSKEVADIAIEKFRKKRGGNR